MPRIILITGSVGAGKTTLARQYARKGYQHINLTDFIKKHHFYERYDKKTQSYLVDEQKLARKLEARIRDAKKKKQNLVLTAIFLIMSSRDTLIFVLL